MYAYYAALCLLDAEVLFSNLKVSDLLNPAIKPVKKLERHHLFPKGYLHRQGISDNQDLDQLANFALVEWSDNIDISDQQPSVYFPPLEGKWPAEDRSRMYFWHALPENWQEMNYQDFLVERRKRIARVIRNGFDKLKV